MSSAAIGRALEARGHTFTLFGFPNLKPWIDKEGIKAAFLSPYPELADRFANAAKKRAISPQQVVASLVQDSDYLHHELPPALQAACVECMVVDANLPAAASVAQALGLPFVTFCSALPPHEEPTIPPGFLPWTYDSGVWGRLRNQSAYSIRDYLVRPLKNKLNSFRRQNGLPLYSALSDALSPLAQVTQLVSEFDFPRTRVPPWFHYVGPYFRRRESEVEFPFDRLDGRPMVYAALGTILGGDTTVWTAITQAAATLPVQLVVALGTREAGQKMPELPGDPIVVPYAPQEQLLSRAALFITHAGLNSAMEGLAHGVPMLAMPFVTDQMGVSSRIVFTGVGQSLGRGSRTPEAIGRAITELLRESGYRKRSLAIGAAIESSEGAGAAAEIFERAGLTGKPVMSQLEVQMVPHGQQSRLR